MTDKPLTIQQVINNMLLRFTSSNGIPVERAHIRAEEWALVLRNLGVKK